MKEPFIQVGILLSQPKIDFSLLTPYRMKGKEIPSGEYSVTFSEGKILFEQELFDEIVFEPYQVHSDSFVLKDVIIGVNFHWERKEDQRFLGGLKFIVENNGVSAVNVVSLEDYLTSVISSEMSATSSESLLKAHAVISRSWLLAQVQKNKNAGNKCTKSASQVCTEHEIIRWYDREDHAHFDVCADDHCQRYQGITRQSTELVKKAVKETQGDVLVYEGAICDTRFYKCCGGATETFENVWEPVVHPYLQGKADRDDNGVLPDLTIEEEAQKWIRSSPPAFCNTQDVNVLKQVLNDYDQETADFYRWKVVYSQNELATIIKERSGIDYGEIVELIPMQRGTSGRIVRLKIRGTKREMIIGKELEIRRTLSRSHLYSSAFVVDTEDIDERGIPGRFVLTGAGWGHGVGLCQIGAAMMAEKGYDYPQILAHYYPGSEIEKKY
ncbi:MAG TPA: SpoIID/LytB domain-containing protein [Dysgonamonadaceae bacterium]|nr:SpoIID/LytB domain-containing protein [Dysgonamonadaceae bacterium]